MKPVEIENFDAIAAHQMRHHKSAYVNESHFNWFFHHFLMFLILDHVISLTMLVLAFRWNVEHIEKSLKRFPFWLKPAAEAYVRTMASLFYQIPEIGFLA